MGYNYFDLKDTIIMIKWIVTALFLFQIQANSAFAQNIPVQTGSFTLTQSVNSVLGTDLAETYSNMIDINDDITWEVDVPELYDPENPPGVLVYISPQNIINIPHGWLDITKKHNLIFISARNSGNKVSVNKRIIMSLIAPTLIQSKYKINTNRIYISGFSGGGRVASMVSTQFPNIFSGTIYICGVNFWEKITNQKLDMIRKNRFVFLTGTEDFNLSDTKNVYARYKKEEVKNIKLIVVAKMRHSNPNRSKFNQAIEFLDKD